MALNFRKFWNGITIKPTAASTQVTQAGDLDSNTTDGKLTFYNGVVGTGSPVVTEAHTATLTNKSISGSDNTLTNIPESALTALTVSRAVVTDGSGILAAATTTATEIGYVNGVTSAIQTQLNGKQATGNYITALTGDVSASGPGSAAATIADLSRSKIAAGTVNHVVINDSSGNLSSEATLAKTRGGTGADNSSVTFPSTGTIATLAGTQTLSNKTFSDAITATQITTPSNPSAGFNKLYFKSDNSLYALLSDGTEVLLGGAVSGTPTGAILAYGGTTAPLGFVNCDGTSYTAAAQPGLAAALWDSSTSKYAYGGSGTYPTGSFNAPDFRGQFLRGISGASTNDPDKTSRTAMTTGGNTGNNIGSVQSNATRKNGLTLAESAHSHFTPLQTGGTGFNNAPSGATGGGPTTGSGNASTSSTSTGITINTGDNETRPLNASVNYIIKT